MLEDVCMCHQLPECHPMGCYWMWPEYCLKLQFFIAKQNPFPPSPASGPFNICFGWKTCFQLLQATEGKLEGAWKKEKGYNCSSWWDARTTIYRYKNGYVRRHDLNLDLILLQLQKRLLSRFETLVLWRIGHRSSGVADPWKERLRVTSVAMPCHTQQQSLMTFTSEGTPHYTRVAHLLHEQQLPARASNQRGSANLRLYTKERREKKFYCHATWAWGSSEIRNSERRLPFSSAVVQSRSRSRSYVVLHQELSIDTGQTIFQQQNSTTAKELSSEFLICVQQLQV
jgi:hypothetical protein